MTTYTKADFFRPARPYSGPHNPAAYAAGIERRKAENARMAQANKADAARTGWLAAVADRPALIQNMRDAAERSEFARSLLEGFAKWGSLTERQEAAARKSFDPAQREAAQAERRAQQVQVADAAQFAAIVQLFQTAALKLKRPGVILSLPDERTVTLKQTGSRSNAPGAIDVKDKATGEWLGRVHIDGRWAPSRDHRSDVAVPALLSAFAQDPAAVAAEYGKRTGHCCFCARPLTDERSTSVGYGPICANHYHLPWGE